MVEQFKLGQVSGAFPFLYQRVNSKRYRTVFGHLGGQKYTPQNLPAITAWVCTARVVCLSLDGSLFLNVCIPYTRVMGRFLDLINAILSARYTSGLATYPVGGRGRGNRQVYHWAGHIPISTSHLVPNQMRKCFAMTHRISVTTFSVLVTIELYFGTNAIVFSP